MQHNEDSGVLEAFAQYTQAFQVFDVRAVAQHFHEPAFFITPKKSFVCQRSRLSSTPTRV